MSIRRVIPLGAVAMLLSLAAAWPEVSVRCAPEKISLFRYEPFTLRLDVESDVVPELPELPVVPDLAVTTVRRLPSDPARRNHAFRIEVIAERDGILSIPPFTVRAGAETALTSALRLRIRAPRPATEMALAITVEPAAIRIGQPATVTVTWTSGVPFARCKQLLLEVPLFADKRCQIFPLDPPVPEAERIGLPVNNVRFFAQAGSAPAGHHLLSFHFELVPRELGVLRAPPARLVCALLDQDRQPDQLPSYFYNHFFEAAGERESFERVYLTASMPEITVTALAESGRKPQFSGIVGPCALRTSVAPTRLFVGQPALFTVHLDDLTFARHLTNLPSAAYAGLRPEFQLSPEPIRETVTDHARSFTRTLRPLQSGITRIPAIVIQTFDPDSGEYRTMRSAPIAVTVAPNPAGTSRVLAPRVDAEPPIPLNGVRHNRALEQTMTLFRHLLERLGRYWWIFVPIPPLLWLALLPLVHRWERCRRDPVYARAVAAWGRFRRTARRDQDMAWRNYLADRLALCAEALTADTVTEALRARHVDAGLVAETRQRFEDQDAVDYGRRPSVPCPSTRSLVRRLHKVTAPLLLLCSLWVAWPGAAAESADGLFALALQMRAEKPDEAQPLFIEAALRFETAERFLNAGNSWFFAGENGRALANYRAAERRSPFDRQLGASIAFLRANRADAFPPPATPTGRVATLWNRFCTWAPMLRVGLFVLVYLLAWLVFLTMRLAGWPVRRRILAVLFVAVLVPLVSLAQSSVRPAEGVVIEDSVARLGPGYAYDPAFAQSLHKAAEFSWLETRQGWVHARLPDASEGWLRESDCMQVK